MSDQVISQGAVEGNAANENNNSNTGVGEMSDVQFGETLDALLEFGGLDESPPPSGDSSGANLFEPLNGSATYSADASLNTTMSNIMKPIVALNLPISSMQQQPILPNPTSNPQRPLHVNQLMIQPMQASVPHRVAQTQQLPSTALSEQFAMPAPPGIALPSSTTSARTTSVPAAKASSTTKKLTSQTTQTKSRPRKRPAPEHISEDETERVKRREERNLREQKRSQQITDQIERLRQVLSDANVPFKADKYSTLSAVVQYVKKLQARSTLLDAEHRKLLQTIVKTSQLANSQYMPTNSTNTPILSTNDLLTESPRTSSPFQDEAMVMVNGIDYKSIFKSCPFAISLASIDGRFIDCNKEFEEVCGHSRQELLRGEAAVAVVAAAETEDSKQAAASSSADKPTDDSASSISSSGIPTSNARNMSLFNVLKRSDMERVFIAMSDMLKRCGTTNNSQAEESDTWMGNVELCRVEKEMRISINLIRSDHGTPRFFSIALLPS